MQFDDTYYPTFWLNLVTKVGLRSSTAEVLARLSHIEGDSFFQISGDLRAACDVLEDHGYVITEDYDHRTWATLVHPE